MNTIGRKKARTATLALSSATPFTMTGRGRCADNRKPARLSESPARLDPIPALGQDTEPVPRELGYTDEDIADLRRTNVI